MGRPFGCFICHTGWPNEEHFNDGRGTDVGCEAWEARCDVSQVFGAGGWKTRGADACVLRWIGIAASDNKQGVSEYWRITRICLLPIGREEGGMDPIYGFDTGRGK